MDIEPSAGWCVVRERGALCGDVRNVVVGGCCVVVVVGGGRELRCVCAIGGYILENG